MALLRISDIAAICNTTEAAVVAASKILGLRRIGECLALSKKPSIDFIREVEFHSQMHQAAEARRGCASSAQSSYNSQTATPV